jgi:hypothetical protein
LECCVSVANSQLAKLVPQVPYLEPEFVITITRAQPKKKGRPKKVIVKEETVENDIYSFTDSESVSLAPYKMIQSRNKEEPIENDCCNSEWRIIQPGKKMKKKKLLMKDEEPLENQNSSVIDPGTKTSKRRSKKLSMKNNIVPETDSYNVTGSEGTYYFILTSVIINGQYFIFN